MHPLRANGRAGDEESVGQLLGRLVSDGKAYVQAETAYYKALAAERGMDAGFGIGFALAALMLAEAALITLLVGLVLLLARPLGLGIALLLVVIVALAVAGLLGVLALRHFRQAAQAPDRGSA